MTNSKRIFITFGIIFLLLITTDASALKLCPACSKTFDDNVNYCPFDGNKLIIVPEKDTVTLDVNVSPSSANLKFNGKTSENNSVKFLTGKWNQISVYAENFITQNFGVKVENPGNISIKIKLENEIKTINNNLKIPTENKILNDMVKIDAGSYSLGSIRGEHDEKVRTVETKGFWIDKTEVTCQQYQKFLQDVRKNGHQWCHPLEVEHKDHTPFHTYAWALRFSWAGGNPPKGMNNSPVVLVDWFDAYAYAKWAGKRLPTEDEWEIAACGMSPREYPWGNTFSTDLCNVGDHPIDVGTYPKGASPWGVLDMAGNVAEWTATAYEPSPRDAYIFHGKYGQPIVRGGSWDDGSSSCRTSSRSTRRTPYYRSTTVGFRCVSDTEIK